MKTSGLLAAAHGRRAQRGLRRRIAGELPPRADGVLPAEIADLPIKVDGTAVQAWFAGGADPAMVRLKGGGCATGRHLGGDAAMRARWMNKMNDAMCRRAVSTILACDALGIGCGSDSHESNANQPKQTAKAKEAAGQVLRLGVVTAPGKVAFDNKRLEAKAGKVTIADVGAVGPQIDLWVKELRLGDLVPSRVQENRGGGAS